MNRYRPRTWPPASQLDDLALATGGSLGRECAAGTTYGVVGASKPPESSGRGMRVAQRGSQAQAALHGRRCANHHATCRAPIGPLPNPCAVSAAPLRQVRQASRDLDAVRYRDCAPASTAHRNKTNRATTELQRSPTRQRHRDRHDLQRRAATHARCSAEAHERTSQHQRAASHASDNGSRDGSSSRARPRPAQQRRHTANPDDDSASPTLGEVPHPRGPRPLRHCLDQDVRVWAWPSSQSSNRA